VTTLGTPPRTTTSTTPFIVLAAVVLAIFGWFAWHLYDQPSNPDEARLKATEMTRILVEGMTGSDTSCPALPNALPGDESTTISRCDGLAAYARQLGLPLASAQDVRVTDDDLHRKSGTVTVAVTLLAQGQQFPMTLGWKMKYVDGHWWVSGFDGAQRA
jgi:hypothetical protein